MRIAITCFLLLAGCSSGSGAPAGACTPSDPACNPGHDAAVAADAGDPKADASDAACVLWVDDAGVTEGCNRGGMGTGDHDDGGGAPPPPPPDAARDAGDLPLTASCWDNAQCASDMCFDFKVRGTFCTKACATNADCPAPSPGCNGMGVCRMPDPGDGGDGG
jgi:hypothetical protein